MLADKTDIENFVRRARAYVEARDFSLVANREMELYNLKMKVSRLELMKYEIMLENMRLHGTETEMLYGRLKDELLEEAKRQAGILGLGDEILKKVLKDQESIINGDFKGTSFSNRIWVNGQELQNRLEDGLLRSLILGENPRQWSGIMHEHLKRNMSDTGKENALFNAFRLAVTETARVQVTTGLKLMKEGGYDKYIWIAEPGACHICAPFNNQVFDMKYASMGNTLPPMHPFCRCSVAAYYDMDEDEDLGYNNSEEYLQEKLNVIDPLTDEELVYQDPYQNILKTDNYKKWESSLTSHELVDIFDYTGTDYYKKMNNFLRGKLNLDDDIQFKTEIENKIKRLDQALSRFTTSEQYTVYRGTYNRYGVENVRVGESFILDKGFASSSFSIDITEEFSGGDGCVLYRIRIPKGKNVGAYLDQLSRFKGEEEFLFRPNTSVKLLKIDKKEWSYGTQWIYDLEVN